ncbi:hypothetical protein DFH09DRAFT_1289825 [Mycena vulgaris]|nr:hypothetical protein DFH09DRAFT_1289825 [Mycena vulgaris]
MSAPPNAESTSPPQTPAKGSQVFKVKVSSQSKSDWLATSLTTAKVIAAGAECIPFPYVKGVFGTVVVILETVEKVKRNREDLKELCEDIVEIIGIVQDRLSSHADTAAVEFKRLCEKLEGVLEDVLQSIKKLPAGARGLGGRFKEVMKLGSTADEIAVYQMRIQKLQSNFMLMAAIDTNLQVHKAFLTGKLPDLASTPATQTVTRCPPPSRIFHGRQKILDKMHHFFKQVSDKQHIFLLHGLGGAGKTQIALKFIEEFSSHFSDIFLIDASTTEIIDTGLKNIAATRNAGDTAQDGLKWLSSNPAEWVLFFDNADDPKINLNNAAQAITPVNKEIATQIDQTLYYFPLAIIQAGAFIAKSGALSDYLTLYAENQARLLSEKPDQSHDDYAQTVYTTWQISFEQLSKPAATVLQLCSFLYHKGISEKIFSTASLYNFPSRGPSREELHDPLNFLSQFSGPTGVWNSLCFVDVMNEITAYSLATFDPDGKVYSIHPLVHNWSRKRLKDAEQLEQAVLEHWRSVMGKLQEAEELKVVVLEKQRKILGEDHPNTLRAMGNLASTYQSLGRLQEAEELMGVVHEKQRKILGEDHPDTLWSMWKLASTNHCLGKLKEAEELYVKVLDRQTYLLGTDHPDTLRTADDLTCMCQAMDNYSQDVTALCQPQLLLCPAPPHDDYSKCEIFQLIQRKSLGLQSVPVLDGSTGGTDGFLPARPDLDPPDLDGTGAGRVDPSTGTRPRPFDGFGRVTFRHKMTRWRRRPPEISTHNPHVSV